jgi:PAS domain S-box-containing protein/diguanylate cyclase (GGDEF)-like protein
MMRSMRRSFATSPVLASGARTATLDLLPTAALELDAHGTVVAANAPALEMFGCSSEGLLGATIDRYLPLGELLAHDGERAASRIEGRRANGVPVLVEVSVRRFDVAEGSHALCVLHELNFSALADESQRYFDAAFDNAPIGMALFNCDGEYVRVNDALCEMLGRTRHDLIGRRDQELTHPDDRQADVDVAWEILAGTLNTHQCEKRFVRPDGSIVWALANLTFLRDEAGRPLSWVGQFQDITARRSAEAATREAEERFRLAFDHGPIGMALVGADGHWLRVNKTLCDMVGYAEDQLLATTFQDITHPDDLDADLEHVREMLAGEIRSYEMEKRYVRADGSIIWILLSVSLVRDAENTPLYFVSQIQDIDERKRAQGELERLAHRDPLTGSRNRRAWDAELARAIARAEHVDEPLAIALIDLNDFKQVNDSQGHDSGDRLLEHAAGAWQEQLRGTDLLARIGGDEFAVLLPECAAADLPAVVQRLKQSLWHDAGCAIGTAVWNPGDGAGELMRRADAALYADKARPAA